MKTKLLLTMILFSMLTVSKAQITLENTYNTDVINSPITRLSLSGVKYVSTHHTNYSPDYFKLYNPDHTLFKTVQIPSLGGSWKALDIDQISETLFDLDSSVEYLAIYADTTVSIGSYKTYVYDENGSVLLYVQDGYWTDFPTLSPVVSVGDSVRLIIQIAANGSVNPFTATQVYSLPGHLTCYECNNGIVNGIANPSGSQVQRPSSIAYPNPSTGSIKIKYLLPAYFHQAYIEIFSMSGNFLKRMPIDRNAEEIILSNEYLPSGEYLYSIVVDGKVVARNKYVLVR